MPKSVRSHQQGVADVVKWASPRKESVNLGERVLVALADGEHVGEDLRRAGLVGERAPQNPRECRRSGASSFITDRRENAIGGRRRTSVRRMRAVSGTSSSSLKLGSGGIEDGDVRALVEGGRPRTRSARESRSSRTAARTPGHRWSLCLVGVVLLRLLSAEPARSRSDEGAPPATTTSSSSGKWPLAQGRSALHRRPELGAGKRRSTIAAPRTGRHPVRYPGAGRAAF